MNVSTSIFKLKTSISEKVIRRFLLFMKVLVKSSIQMSGRKRPILMSGKSVRLRAIKNVDMLIGAENCTGFDIK